ncbi:hypothetical protein [Hymenobacter elongatus]|uniref:Uncharacterized protein n=1 Tax=Hymenobacter elongatus TaxID=877208 RepID=A0A4Z0PR34_9BACT|nr:hypothetical protein [Hymenobacter elongatus]TGE19799.1 hypothetical protein E5J99_01475 [Hymenobacter elongatus]
MHFSLSDAWLAQLPADFYDQLAHCLSLHGMVCTELFSRPDSALVGQLALLSTVDAAVVGELNTIQSQEQLVAALHQRPGQVYDLLVLGRLGLDTSLAEPVLRFVRQQMNISEVQMEALKAYCLELSDTFLASVEQHLAETDRSTAGRLGQHRLQLEEAFFSHSHSQAAGATLLPTVATVRFNEPQLQMIRLAVLLVHGLPAAAGQPFLQAVERLAALRPAALEPLMERLGSLPAGHQLPLTMPELVQLYQAMQVCGLVFVSDVLATLGLEEFMTGPPDTATPAADTAAPMSSRQAVGEMVSGFTEWVQANFAEEAAIQQARQQIADLTDLV